MPIYEYSCQDCRTAFEELRAVTDRSRPTCPACGARRARRLISRSSFQLKGGGWYKDLYSSPRSSSPATGDAGSSSKT